MSFLFRDYAMLVEWNLICYSQSCYMLVRHSLICDKRMLYEIFLLRRCAIDGVLLEWEMWVFRVEIDMEYDGINTK